MKYQSSFYSVSYRTTSMKICQDTDNHKVGEEHVASKFNSFHIQSDLLFSKIAK